MSFETFSYLVTVFVLLLGHVLFAGVFRPKQTKLGERLNKAEEKEIEGILKDAEASPTRYGRFYGGYIYPKLRLYPDLFQMLPRYLGLDMDRLDSKIRNAKLRKVISAEELLSMKLIGVIGAVGFGLSGMAMQNTTFFLLAVFSYVLGAVLPMQVLERKIRDRKESIIRELPDFLDLLKSVTEAGLIIQDAITKVTAKVPGALTEEFRDVMVETKSNGGNWRLAMENMALRNDVDALSDVVSDVLISYEKGTCITDTLFSQAKKMRILKNNHLIGKARGLTIKLLIPLALFSFFPSAVILALPIIIEMGRNFLQ